MLPLAAALIAGDRREVAGTHRTETPAARLCARARGGEGACSFSVASLTPATTTTASRTTTPIVRRVTVPSRYRLQSAPAFRAHSIGRPRERRAPRSSTGRPNLVPGRAKHDALRSLNPVYGPSHSRPGACKTWARRIRRAGSPRTANPGLQRRTDSESVASVARSLPGSNACVGRVAMDGHPGLARSTDCAAQWIHGDPERDWEGPPMDGFTADRNANWTLRLHGVPRSAF